MRVCVYSRVDHLYSFFVQWSPDVYGKEAREQGFVVVEKDELDMIDNFFSDPASRSWEVGAADKSQDGSQDKPIYATLQGQRCLCVTGFPLILICLFHSKIITIDEAKRRQSFGSCDGDLSVDALPMLSDTSDLLQDTHIEKVLAAD